jgi:hypothetical protein
MSAASHRRGLLSSLRVLLFVAGLAAAACGHPEPTGHPISGSTKTAPPPLPVPSISSTASISGKAIVMEVVPSSRSLILKATHILLVKVEASTAGPYQPPGSGVGQRSVHLRLALDEVLKGTLRQAAGAKVEIDVKQTMQGFTWGPLPGIWSEASIDPGARLVVLASTASDDAAVVLNDPAAFLVSPPEGALADARIARQAEDGHFDLAAVLALAKPQAPALQALFADWLWERHGAAAMASFDAFDRLAAFLEEPGLHLVARTTLVMALTTAVQQRTPPPEKHLARLAVALFRLLGLKEAAPQHDNLVSTYLPNLLRAADPPSPPPDVVFRDYPGEKAKAQQAVQGHRGAASTAALQAWLAR